MTDARSASGWLTDHAHLLPISGAALDVACGRGRNALWLAARGLATLGIDRDAAALTGLATEARRRGLAIETRVVDLEAAPPAIERGAYDVVLVINYLHRELFPVLKAAVRPGGVLVYETFTQAQALRGRPTNPAFLLRDGELQQLAAPFRIVAEREGDFEGKMLASVIAVAP